MRTEVIDQACERFRHRLEERLGKGFEVGSPRVAFDSAGRHVRAPVSTPLGELAFRSSLLDEEGGSFSWSFDGERGLADRWRASTHIGSEASLRADAEALCAAVRPTRHAWKSAEPREMVAALGEEGVRLEAAFVAFGRHYGESMGLLSLAGDATPSVAYPHVTDQEVLLYAPPPFREDAHTAAYIEDLGFAVNAHHRVFAVPSPSTYERRLARLGGRGGLRPELQLLGATLFSARQWLTGIAAGVFPINVHGLVSKVAGVVGGRVAVHRSQREKLHTHFHALGHDMGIHTLAMHRVPSRRMREFRRLASVALHRGGAATTRAADFFEERLTRACVETWAGAPHADAFADRFEARFPALVAELARGAYG